MRAARGPDRGHRLTVWSSRGRFDAVSSVLFIQSQIELRFYWCEPLEVLTDRYVDTEHTCYILVTVTNIWHHQTSFHFGLFVWFALGDQISSFCLTKYPKPRTIHSTSCSLTSQSAHRAPCNIIHCTASCGGVVEVQHNTAGGAFFEPV